MRIKQLLAGLSGSLLLSLGMPMAAIAATTTVVTPGNMNGWGFAQETATGSGEMVTGPGTPPLGTGSANLIVDNTGGEVIAKAGYQGLDLAAINKLEYSTYRTAGAPALAIALQFNVDVDSTDNNTGFQGRLVYEPYHTQTVTTGTWQTWDTLNDDAGTGSGNWWFTRAPQNGICSQANPCTWSELKAAFPNAEIHGTLGALYLKAGGGWTGGFNGNVDALTINEEIFDFEPTVTVSNKDACKNDGWKASNTPVFKNQGDCVSSFASNGKARGNSQLSNNPTF